MGVFMYIGSCVYNDLSEFVERRRLMTIAIGIKCTDGIVVASDSQSEYERGVDVKRLTQSKIHDFDNCYLFAGAGIMSQIQILIDTVKSSLQQQHEQQRTALNKDETEAATERALLALVKHYNVDRSAMLGIEQPEFFSPLVIFAGADTEEGFYLDLLHGSVGLVEPMIDTVAVGSGAAYAELLFRNFQFQEIGVQRAAIIASYIVSEVIAIDPHCGGQIQVASITRRTDVAPNKERMIPTQVKYYDSDAIEKYLEVLGSALHLARTRLIPKILAGEINEDQIKQFTANTQREGESQES